jgi:hypothetical protein
MWYVLCFYHALLAFCVKSIAHVTLAKPVLSFLIIEISYESSLLLSIMLLGRVRGRLVVAARWRMKMCIKHVASLKDAHAAEGRCASIEIYGTDEHGCKCG